MAGGRAIAKPFSLEIESAQAEQAHFGIVEHRLEFLPRAVMVAFEQCRLGIQQLDQRLLVGADQLCRFLVLLARERRIAGAGSDLANQLELAADALRLPPWEASIGTLSGGEKRRVALCKLLLSKPDMLLLDEPTNHLDAESVDWLEQFLVRFPGTVVAVTHDRYFLDNAAEWILELDRG
ncbi:MAG: ATP-binding cassette domain-containing protein, partial [Rhizobiaceae bacterium]